MKSIDEVYYATEKSNEAITTDSGENEDNKNYRNLIIPARSLFAHLFLPSSIT
jgi:hypothetical protein